MYQFNQDFSARTRFDTVLPEDARSELRRPKRPVILGRPIYQPPKRSNILKWGSAILVVALLAANAINTRQQPAIGTQKQSVPIVQPTPSPAVQPAPSAPVHRSSSEESRLVIAPAPRATLVKLPPPRAQLVRVPVWMPGEARIMHMPYDMKMEVRGVLKGYLSDERFLPRSGNHIGDTWIVSNTPWVWITVPGTTAPVWVDP